MAEAAPVSTKKNGDSPVLSVHKGGLRKNRNRLCSFNKWNRLGPGDLSVMRQDWGDCVSKSRHTASEMGRRVARLRSALGLSRKDLAQALGYSGPSSIESIENGRSIKQYVQLADMAVLLKTTPDQLLGFSELPLADQGDQLDMMGAAIQKMLMDVDPTRWPRERAEALVDIATEVALEKSELDLDRRLAEAFRRHALKPPT